MLQEDAVQCMEEISNIMRDSDVSPFEIIHSGLVGQLLSYLVESTEADTKDDQLRHFLHVFLNCPVSSYLKIIQINNNIL